jgi:hypothetical protein
MTDWFFVRVIEMECVYWAVRAGEIGYRWLLCLKCWRGHQIKHRQGYTIKARTHSCEQADLSFPDNLPITISDSLPAGDFKDVSPRFEEAGVFISQQLHPLI